MAHASSLGRIPRNRVPIWASANTSIPAEPTKAPAKMRKNRRSGETLRDRGPCTKGLIVPVNDCPQGLNNCAKPATGLKVCDGESVGTPRVSPETGSNASSVVRGRNHLRRGLAADLDVYDEPGGRVTGGSSNELPGRPARARLLRGHLHGSVRARPSRASRKIVRRVDSAVLAAVSRGGEGLRMAAAVGGHSPIVVSCPCCEPSDA